MKTGSSRKVAGLLLFAAAAAVTPLAAQEGAVLAQQGAFYTPHFFMAVLGGVILAFGFQILLTSLSVASGISLVGNVEEKAEEARQEKAREKQSRRDKFQADEEKFERQKFVGAHNVNDEEASPHEKALRAEARRDETRRQQMEAEEEEDDSAPIIVKISNAIGIWTVVTASISLFFASLLAVRLSLVGTVWMGITLGLIIWAAFFATMTYLEIRSVTTLIGGVFGAALNGMRSSFSAAKMAFGTSPEEKVTQTVTELAGNVRQELAGVFDEGKILDKVDEYVKELKPQPLDFDRIKEELLDLARNVRIQEHADVREGSLDRETFIKLASEQPHFKKEDVEKISGLYDEFSEAVKSRSSGTGKMEALAQKFSPADEQDIQQYRQKMESYLRDTGREELDPERIKDDINRMFEDPKSTPEILMKRVHAMDRDTLVAVLSQRDDISQDQANQILNNVEKAVDFVRQKVLQMKGEAGSAAGQMQGKADQAKAMGQSMLSAATALPGKLEDQVRGYFASLNRPEFNYDRIRLDFERMIHDPGATPKILRARLKMYDRDSLKALLASRKDVSEQEAEEMVMKMEEARDNVIHKAEKIESEVRRRIDEAKRMAIHEVESVRKASATAAWWMVGTAVVSGAFSALGAILAITW